MEFWKRDLPGMMTEFGTDVTWQSTDGPRQVRVLFDDEYLAAALNEGAVSVSSPQIFAPAAQLPGVALGQTITVPVDSAEVDYRVMEIQPDGLGGLVLRLSKDSV